jgi:FlaA1/EpsC-like NDP-sugar epimerase/lipopolysaccharide/colanic/teichoic acid biosynthesis glycosyltransferase
MNVSKRIFDLFWSIVGLLFFSPFFLIIAAAIRLSDGGPAFFRQERVGYRGRTFRMWKFRTMEVDAEKKGFLTVGHDTRITKVGRWLRTYKLDELPQLLNVLMGEMSIVGPRPEVPRYVALYNDEQKKVLDLMPGITDPASLKYINESMVLNGSPDPESTYIHKVMPEKIRMNLEYAGKRSLFKDALIIIKTVNHFIYRNNYYLVIALDTLLVFVAYILAYLLRFDMVIPSDEWIRIRMTLPFVVPLKILTFYFLGLYHGMWRYTSLRDFINIFKATVLSSFLLLFIILLGYRFEGFSRSVYIIDGALTFFLIGGFRGGIRIAFSGNIPTFWTFGRYVAPEVKKLLIIGAGDAGEKFLREIMENPALKLHAVGFIDDDKMKHWKVIHGVPVLGGVDDMDHLSVDFDEILIAIPSAKSDQMRRIVAACKRSGKQYRTMPSLGELIDGKVSVRLIREVRLEDILGRDEVRLDRGLIGSFLRGRRILVTGAGGSIGSELVRQIGYYEPSSIALLDFSEFNLFQMEMECRQHFGNFEVKTILTDIRDRESLRRAFVGCRPEVIFHAAAYKHVPLQELHPREAIVNNVLGTRNVALIARDLGVERFVLVSSDKAVRPANIMGATKRVSELIVLAMNDAEIKAKQHYFGSDASHGVLSNNPHNIGNLGKASSMDQKIIEKKVNRKHTAYLAVRFGNVIGSSGSVIPIFQQQIEHRHPVTVTHPDATRYFMTIPEAAQLILQAAAMGKGGEIFILDMGQPVRIDDMARDLIRLHGLEPDRDIPIQYVGLRPGEKLCEELITEEEEIFETSHKKIKMIQSRCMDLLSLTGMIDNLLMAADSYDELTMKEVLAKIVNEYIPSSSES